MEVRLVDRQAAMLVGLVASGAKVGDMDIAWLWQQFEQQYQQIKCAVPEQSYEVHIEEPAGTGLHFCFVGVQVTELNEVPPEMFIKLIPAGRYLLFTHCFRDGGFSIAFGEIYEWLARSDYRPAYPLDIQCYDQRFKGPDNPESVLEILVPVR